MLGPITGREIIMFCACIFLAYFLFIKTTNTSELEKDKIRSEEAIKEYQKQEKQQAHITDSLKQNASVMEAIIEYQKKNPKLIIEKYDKILNGVSLLNADNSVKFLSDKLSKESNH